MAEETMNLDIVDASFDSFKDEDNVWEKMKQAKENKETLTVVTDKPAVKGGVTASVDGKRAFIPASMLSLSRVENLDDYCGKELEVRVVEVDEEKNRIILSAKAVLSAKVQEEATARLNALEAGSVLEGTVESLKPYGAFVKIDDAITGLVHVSQISVKRIKDPSQVLKVGETVKVKVLGVKDGKLSLSIKALSAPAEETEVEEVVKVKLPKVEPLVTNMGDLLKGFKID